MNDYGDKVLVHYAPEIDTENLVYTGESLDIENKIHLEKFEDLCRKLGLRKDRQSKYLIRYRSDEKLNYYATFYKVSKHNFYKISFYFNSAFHRASNSEKKKMKIMKLMLRKFKKLVPKIERIDIFQDIVTKQDVQLFDIFPNVFDSKKYQILSSGLRKSVGYNDMSNIEKKTHLELSVYRRAKLKIYNKTNSLKNNLKLKKVSVEDYSYYGGKFGLNGNGVMNTCYRAELSLTGDFCQVASVLLISKRLGKTDLFKYQDIYRKILGHFGNSHKIVYSDTGNIVPIFESLLFLKDKTSTLVKLKERLAIENKMPIDTLKRLIQRPSPKRTLESHARSVAKKILRSKHGLSDTKSMYKYFCRTLKWHLANEKQEAYKDFYYFYLQKAYLSEGLEREFYEGQAKRAKDEGYLEFHITDDFFEGLEGKPRKIPESDPDGDLLEALLKMA